MDLLLTTAALLLARPDLALDAEAKLKSVAEHRHADVIAPDPDAMRMFGDEPRLVLSFELSLPEGRRLAALSQPKTLTARDSAGTDLSQIEPGFSDEREYMEIAMSWDDDAPPVIEVKLAPSARAATTFDFATTLELQVFNSVEEVVLTPGKDWAPLDPAMFGPGAKVRLDDDGLEVSPPSVDDRIESVTYISGDRELTSSGWFSSGSSLTYMIDGSLEEGASVRLEVRAGFETMSIPLALKGAALP